MSSNKSLIGVVVFIILGHLSFGQSKLKPFRMPGNRDQTIELNQTFTETTEIFPFGTDSPVLYGLAIKADLMPESDESIFRAVLTDSNLNEYLIYEWYPLLEPDRKISVGDLCEETCLLEGVRPRSVRIEITHGKAVVHRLSLSASLPPGLDVRQARREQLQSLQAEKIKKMNRNLADRGIGWVAGPTGISALSYSQRKKLFRDGAFPPGFEYYTGGVVRAGNPVLKSAEESRMADSWDWRDRHGQNWLTPAKDQGFTGSCWAFAATGATEALVNLFFNQHHDLDLSEQDIISCSGKGNSNGGLPKHALDYIFHIGIVDEASFSYTGTDRGCSEKGRDPADRIQIGGRIDFDSEPWPRSEDVLKKMLMEYGPLSSGLYDWSHAMVLVGYHKVKEGDRFYYRNAGGVKLWYEIAEGDPLIGKTVWIFKNSWGPSFGDNGYVYVETDISNVGWTHALKTPVKSLVQHYTVRCADNDGDGYFWWGLGPKPQYCTCPDEPDGDDSNPGLGPLDEFGNCRVLTASPVASFSVSSKKPIVGDRVSFTDLSPHNPTSWSWTFEGGTPERTTDRNPAVVYHQPGLFDVTLIVENSTGADTLTMEDYIVTSGHTEKGANEQEIITSIFSTDNNAPFSIYPNPVVVRLNLRFKDHTDEGRYFIYNSLGQPIASERIISPHTAMDVSGFAPGIYYISVVGDEKRWTGKFVKR